MKDKRRYQRYAVNENEDTDVRGEVIVEGELVQLVDFSIGGLCVLSKKLFTPETVSISVEFGDHEKIDLIGKVARVKQEGDMWRITMDLTEIYKQDTLRKI